MDPLLNVVAHPLIQADVEALYVEHRARLLGLAAAITLDRAVAEEIVQDAFAGLQRRAHGIDNYSRVVALISSDCEATKIAKYTTGTAVDFATADELQALVLGPLPPGTSIVVLIGNDNLSQLTTGVTTTSNGF